MSKFILLTGIILILIAYIYDAYTGRPTARAMNHWHSSAFHGPGHPDHLTPPNEYDIITIPVPEFTFHSTVPETSRQVLLTFRYRCHPNCQQIWIELQTQPATTPQKYLVRHPVLDEVPWFSIFDRGLFLYQRRVNYASLADFLNQLPSQRVATEYNLMQQYSINNGNQVLLTDIAQLGDIDYVLTTYDRPKYITNDWAEYSRAIPVNSTQRDEQGRLTWILTVNPGDNHLPEIWITTPVVEYL
jgi:hypothetical protein